VKVLALDFDGVVSDSAMESFIVALRTHAALRPSRVVADLVDELGGAAAERVRAHPFYRDFVDLMPLGNRAEDFGVALGALLAGDRLDDQAAYDARRAAEPAAFLEGFHERFYRERAAFRREDPEAWARLLRPYPSVVELIRRRSDEVVPCIATAKDRPTVELLLELYGIADLFPAERLVDKEHGVTKRAHLTALHERLGVDYAEITFVDDKVNHLQDVASLGVRCALAAWGYNGEREQRLARGAGHLVCTLDDLEERLFGSRAGSG